MKSSIFKPNHQYIPYYTSSFLLYKFEKYIRTGIVDRKYNKARYHVLLLYKSVSGGESTPELYSKKMGAYCTDIINTLKDVNTFTFVFDKIKKIIDESGLYITTQKLLYQKSNTDLLMKAYTKLKANGTI